MMFSYFPYAAAFAAPDGESGQIDTGLLGIGLAMAPFVFVTTAFVSRNPLAFKRVLQAMGLLLVIGLAVGLLSPVLGATAGFAVGGAITLSIPGVGPYLKWRFWACLFTAIYTLALLVAILPAGVFTGGLLPLLMLGLVDEYTAWRAAQPT